MSIRQRLYPTEEQESSLVEWCHQARFVYNVLCGELHGYVNAKDSGGAWVWEKHRDLLVRRLRDRLPWLKAGPSVVHQGASRDFSRAMSRWSNGRAEMPTFHRKDEHSGSFVVRDVSVRKFNKGWGVVSIPKVGFVRFRLSQSFTKIAEAKSARVKHENGRWFVSFVTAPRERPSRPDRVVGVDRGVKVTMMTSDGERFHAPQLSTIQQERYVRLERAKARSTKGSMNRRRILGAMARLRARQGDLTKDFVEKSTTSLASRYGTVVLEDLKVSNMVASPKPKPDPEHEGEFLPNGAAVSAALSRLIHASHWGELRSRLSDKTTVVLVNPANTSRMCSACGHVAKENRESQAVFLCVSCGHGENADLNAAKNILARAGLNPRASGDRAESKDDANLLVSGQQTALSH